MSLLHLEFRIPHRDKSRAEFEKALLQALLDHGIKWIALAGFMRLLSGDFLGHFPNRVLNIHPSLLPSFPGARAQEQGTLGRLARGVAARVSVGPLGGVAGPAFQRVAKEVIGYLGVRPNQTDEELATMQNERLRAL